MLTVFKNVKDRHMEKELNLSLLSQNDRIRLTGRDYKNIGFDSTQRTHKTCILLKGLFRSLI